MTNVNTTEFLRVVGHAASMNDHWLFLVALCLLLLGCGTVIYCLVKQLQTVLVICVCICFCPSFFRKLALVHRRG